MGAKAVRDLPKEIEKKQKKEENNSQPQQLTKSPIDITNSTNTIGSVHINKESCPDKEVDKEGDEEEDREVEVDKEEDREVTKKRNIIDLREAQTSVEQLTHVPDEKKYELKQYLEDEGYEFTHVNKDTFKNTEMEKNE